MINQADLAFLERLAQQIKTQDNHGTSEPMVEVRDVERIYGVTEDYTEKFSWINRDNDEAVGNDALIEKLNRIAMQRSGSDEIHTEGSYRRHINYQTIGSGLEFYWTDVNTGEVVRDDELLAKLDDAYEDLDIKSDEVNLGEHYSRIGYVEIEKTVGTFFTQQSAEDYIKRNRHNLNAPYSYIVSACRNPEMETLRRLLAGDIVNALKASTVEEVPEVTESAPGRKHKL